MQPKLFFDEGVLYQITTEHVIDKGTGTASNKITVRPVPKLADITTKTLAEFIADLEASPPE